MINLYKGYEMSSIAVSYMGQKVLLLANIEYMYIG